MFGSCGRIGQYVPGTASFSSVGSWLAADESCATGTGVNAWPDHAMLRLQTRLTGKKFGANAKAPAALSATAAPAMVNERRNINRPEFRIQFFASASLVPVAE
jgi:hypothetical protein